MWSGEAEKGPLEDLWNLIMLQVRPIAFLKIAIQVFISERNGGV